MKPSASPIVILQPMGPVMFVFDVSDTEEGPYARPLPDRVVKPFAARGGRIGDELWRHEKIPRISLECLMKAAGIIEKMGQKRLKPKKDTD